MSFDRLQTDRLIIRPFAFEDAEDLFVYRSHPQVAKFQSAYSKKKTDELINEMAKSDPSVAGKWFQFAVELKAECRLIGDIGFLNFDENGKSWIGFTLNPKYWNCGYASEAVKAILGYYANLGISEVWASTDPENHASMKLLRALEFQLVEVKPEDMIFRRIAIE